LAIHERVVPLGEDNREPVEVEHARHLPEEAAQSLFTIERRRKRPAYSVDRIELICPAPQAVAQLLGLCRTALGRLRFPAQAKGEPSDDQPHEDLDPERKRDRVDAEGAVVAVGAQRLAPREKRREHNGDHDGADDPIAHRALDDRQDHDLPHRRIRLVGVVDDDVRRDHAGVESKRGEAEQLLRPQDELAPGKQPDRHRPDSENRRDHPGPELVPRRVAGDDADLDDRKRNTEQADPRDPAFPPS
jgi:hypothetical protein